MRETQRRRLLYRTHKQAQDQLKRDVAQLLARRYKALKRELRRANLRKRLRKTDGVLQKGDGGWAQWISDFSEQLQESLKKIAEMFIGVESEYFTSHGADIPTIDSNKVVSDYHDKIGRQITDIGEETLNLTQDKIRDWYNSEEGLNDLIDDLSDIYDEDRAELIARTEAGFVRSEVALEMMQFYGINKWIWDSALEDRTCEFCSEMHGQVFDDSDDMPPDASHPNCLCGVVYANDDGSELIY